MSTWKYLYGIMPCSEERAFADVAAIGDPTARVHTVACSGLGVVASDSPARRYDTTRANLLAHERVLERVMKESGLLPIRFGTVADSTTPVSDIQKLLCGRRQEFQGLLAEMEGKAELGLKVLWRDERRVFDEIMARHEAIRRLRRSLAGKPPQATHFERIRLGEMVKNALDRQRGEEAAGILAALRRLAVRMGQNPVVGDRMVVNAAFLVARAREGEFDSAVAALERELGERYLFKYVGPVPPYNFVNIVVNWEAL